MTTKIVPQQQIYNSALKFLIPLSLEKTYSTIVKEAVKLTNAKYGSIFLPEDGQMKRVYTTSKSLQDIKPRKGGKTMEVYRTGKPYLELHEDMLQRHPDFSRYDVGSGISAPLRYNRKTIGVLSVLSQRDRVFAQNEVDTLTAFAPLATIAIQQARHFEDLQKALSDKDLFISIAAHELKTPLTAVNAYVQLMLKQENPSKVYMEKLSREILRLSKLVSELFEVNRIRVGGLSIKIEEKCNIFEIVEDVIDDMKKIFPHHIYELQNELTESVTISADRDKLTQVFTNILSNASKYSPSTHPVTIRLSHQEGYIVIAIRDEGKGIAKKELAHVFERYYKASNSEKSGMGIGLYLVKEIIEKHSGKIKLESRLGEGTTVSVYLPS